MIIICICALLLIIDLVTECEHACFILSVHHKSILENDDIVCFIVVCFFFFFFCYYYYYCLQDIYWICLFRALAFTGAK